MERVTIIITTYNYDNYISDAIDSALAQTYPNIEIIVVDDGSTDRTEEVVTGRYGPKVRYLFRSNGGSSAARNTGLSEARGDFICFLDADDLLLPHMVEKQMDYLRAHETIDLVCSNAEYIGAKRGVARPALHLKGDRQLEFADFVNDNPIGGIHTVLLRRKVFDLCGIFDEKLSDLEDYEYWLRCAGRVRIAYRDDIVAQYRRHDRNKTNNQIISLNHYRKILTMQQDQNPSETIQRSLQGEVLNIEIRLAWMSGQGRKARRLIRQYKDLCPVAPKPTAHVWLASWLPYGFVMGARWRLGQWGLLSPIPKPVAPNPSDLNQLK